MSHIIDEIPEFLELTEQSESPIIKIDRIALSLSELQAEIQSLHHGLGVVEQKLQDLAELPGIMKEEVKNAARD